MNTLKSQVGDIGIRSLLESKKGWSQGTAIVFSLGRNINGLLKHVISNSHAHTNSKEELALMIFLSFWNAQDQNQADWFKIWEESSQNPCHSSSAQRQNQDIVVDNLLCVGIICWFVLFFVRICVLFFVCDFFCFGWEEHHFLLVAFFYGMLFSFSRLFI